MTATARAAPSSASAWPTSVSTVQARVSARPRRPRAARGRGGSRPAGRDASPRCRSWRAGAGGPRRSSSRSELSSPSVAARIAVSGERRSWLTARRIAVLTASLRRRSRPRPPGGRVARGRSRLPGARRAGREPARELGIGLGLQEEPAHVPVPRSRGRAPTRRARAGGTESSSIRARATPSDLGDPVRDLAELAWTCRSRAAPPRPRPGATPRPRVGASSSRRASALRARSRRPRSRGRRRARSSSRSLKRSVCSAGGRTS